MANTLPTPEYLQEVLNYDPDTGVWTWRVKLRNGKQAGEVAGYVDRGYVRIKLNGMMLAAHRMAVAYMTGKWPAEQVDHRDKDGLNNRWLNLRPASPRQNAFNKSVYKNNATGVKGVRVLASGRFQARILDKALGTFDSAAEAGAAYVVAAREICGEFAYA